MKVLTLLVQLSFMILRFLLQCYEPSVQYPGAIWVMENKPLCPMIREMIPLIAPTHPWVLWGSLGYQTLACDFALRIVAQGLEMNFLSRGLGAR